MTWTMLELCCMIASAMSAVGACPVVCIKNRTDLVRVQSQSCQAARKWTGPATRRRHPSSRHIRPRSWRTTRLWTDDVKARFQGRQHLLVSTRQVRHLFSGREVTAQLVSAFVLSRLDYCNSLLISSHLLFLKTYNLPRSTIESFQRIFNAATRHVVNLGPSDPVTPALKQLHWLPVEHRIQYKLRCLLMHLVHTRKALQYMTDIALHYYCLLCPAAL